MKLITRDTDYAIRALLYISCNKDRVIPASELSKKLKIPRPFLRKILQMLNKGRLLRSYKGLGGGFQLNVPADKVFLLDLIKIFQGPFKLNECFFKKKICPNIKACLLKKKMDAIENYVIRELGHITIAGLLR